MSTVGVVTIAHGRHARLADQHRSLVLGSSRPDLYTVVAMGDPAITADAAVLRCGDTRGLDLDVVHLPAERTALPLAAARNRGVERLVDRGADVLIVLDVDCLAGHGLVAAYRQAVERHPERVWSGPVTYLPPGLVVDHPADLAGHFRPHPARPSPALGEELPVRDPSLFWSLSFATTPDTWVAVGGFDEGYVGYGGEDTDFAQRALRAGVESWWVGGARAYHQHHRVSSPPVEHLDSILVNGRRFFQLWGWWPMGGWLRAFEDLGLVERVGDDWVATPRSSRVDPVS